MCYTGRCEHEKQNGDCKARPEDRCPVDEEEVVDPVIEKLDVLHNSLIIRNSMEMIKELILIVRNWE